MDSLHVYTSYHIIISAKAFAIFCSHIYFLAVLYCFVFMLSLELCRYSFDISCPAAHVPDWQTRILLGIVNANE